jgi:predicted kinase
MHHLFVVISGSPGSGKSSVAEPLARALDLPLLTKDTIKEALGDVLGAANREESQRLGDAARHAMLEVAKAQVGAVIESTWQPDLARLELAALDAPIVEVHVAVPVDEAIRRYAERAGERHPVHFDEQNVADRDAFEVRAQPIAGDWRVIEVDGLRDVDVDALVEQILAP